MKRNFTTPPPRSGGRIGLPLESCNQLFNSYIVPNASNSDTCQEQSLRAPRANRGFGTDEKRIRTKTTVIDKSKSVTLQQRSPRTSGNALEQRQHVLEGFAIRRIHEKHAVQPRLREYGLFLAECAKTPFSMVGARAAGAHAAERLVLLGDVPYAVIQSDPAGNRLVQHLVAARAVGTEPVQSQRPVVTVDIRDSLFDSVITQHRQDRAENLLLHQLHLRRRSQNQHRRLLAPGRIERFGGWIDSHDARALGPRVFQQSLQAGEMAVADDAGVVRVGGEARVHFGAVSYTHLRAHETRHDLVCR